jgi:hypothetical protein
MIQLTFGSTDRRLLESFRLKRAAVVPAMSKTLDELMLELQRSIERKLSGEVLQHRSGKAQASVIKQPTVDSGNTISGRVTGGGGPAFYLRIQELGGTRTYDIYPRFKKALAFFPGGSLGAGGGIVPLRKDILRGLYVRSGSKRGDLKANQLGNFSSFGGVVVKHVVHPPLKPRPTFRPSLMEMQSRIREKLQKSMQEALRS